MAVRKLTFDRDLPDQVQIVLGYRLRFWWNPRTLHWMCDGFTEAGEPLFLGDALNPGSVVGAGCLDFAPTLVACVPDVQKLDDLWTGRGIVIHVEP